MPVLPEPPVLKDTVVMIDDNDFRSVVVDGILSVEGDVFVRPMFELLDTEYSPSEEECDTWVHRDAAARWPVPLSGHELRGWRD